MPLQRLSLRAASAACLLLLSAAAVTAVRILTLPFAAFSSDALLRSRMCALLLRSPIHHVSVPYPSPAALSPSNRSGARGDAI
eukprot:362412-Chlamydomonas_euryale.AAC.5